MGSSNGKVTFTVDVATDDHSVTEIADRLGKILSEDQEVARVGVHTTSVLGELASELREAADEYAADGLVHGHLRVIADRLDGADD